MSSVPAIPLLSIVIPVHNEAAFMPGAVARLHGELADIDATYEVILAENGSFDGTQEVVARMTEEYPAVRSLTLPTPDYGTAMRAGFLAATGDWVVNFDIDYFSGDFLRMVLERTETADVILASKRTEGADDRRGIVRRLATFVFNTILLIAVGSRVSDTHGMKAIRRTVVAEHAPLVVSRQDLFDTELVIRAQRAGYRVVEVPALVEELREAKSSLWKRVPRTLRGIWRIRRALRREQR